MYVHTGYNDVTVIPSDARHVNIMDNSGSNSIFIGMYVCIYVHTCHHNC